MQTAETNLSTWQKVALVALLAAVVGNLALRQLEAAKELLFLVTILGVVDFGCRLVFMIISTVMRKGEDPEQITLPLPLPRITILSPMYKEPGVAERHVRAVSQLIWPGEIEHLILVREEDWETRRVLEALPLPPQTRLLLVPPAYYGTKPAALKYALLHATGEFFVIYDAENVPDPYQLVKAYDVFLNSPPNVAGVQAVPTVANWTRGFWPAMMAAEYTGHYWLQNPASLSLGLLTPLPGNSVLFRTEAVKKIGGYDRYNKAEDAYLSVCLYRGGYTIRYVESDTLEEAPKKFMGWMRQRRRWMDGFLQTYFVSMRNPLQLVKQLGLLNFMVFQVHFAVRPLLQFLNPLLMALITIYAVCLTPWVRQINPTLVSGIVETLQKLYTPEAKAVGMTLMILGNLCLFYTLILACMRQRMWRIAPLMLLVMPYWVAQNVAQWWAAWDFSRKAGWHKTDHEDETDAVQAAPAFAFIAPDQLAGD